MQIIHQVSMDTANTTTITCRLDYCNALLCGISDSLVQRLQSVQNAAARLVTGAGRREDITSVLRQLHWLPVRQRIDFKVMVLVYKSLHHLAPPYLSDDCQLVTDVGRRHLRSADVHTCTVPRTQSRLGDRSFGVARPWLWNNLPVELRQQDICLTELRRLLKTVLFAEIWRTVTSLF